MKALEYKKGLIEYTRKKRTNNLLYEYKGGRKSFCLEAQNRFQREEPHFPTILSTQSNPYTTV